MGFEKVLSRHSSASGGGEMERNLKFGAGQFDVGAGECVRVCVVGLVTSPKRTRDRCECVLGCMQGWVCVRVRGSGHWTSMNTIFVLAQTACTNS